MVRIPMVKRGGRLVPANEHCARQLDRVPDGATVMADIRRPRNIARHRLWWALASAIADMLNNGPGGGNWTAERVSDRMKIGAGHSEIIRLPGSYRARYGASFAVMPRSISFASLGEDEFREVLDAAIEHILVTFAPVLDSEEASKLRAIAMGEEDDQASH